jgi:uncharacterized protein (TIGR02757 family)
MKEDELKIFLDELVDRYNRPAFIAEDPISIPHLFSKLQDIEISGLFAAVLAWGQRKTIIRKCRELMAMMDDAPYEFVQQHRPADLRPLESFCHRTFNGVDTLYFVRFLQQHYSRHASLESAFSQGLRATAATTEEALVYFHRQFFSLEDAPQRTRKHIATPERKSACKRLNMYLRWMVRRDDRGVDFGLWQSIRPAQLVCPCDVHVDRMARELGLLQRRQTDWQAALQLTEHLRRFDPEDPVKYDFALFGLGVIGY